MKEKVNELLAQKAPHYEDLQKLYQEAASEEIRDEIKRSFKDFAHQLLAPARTDKERAEAVSDLMDIIQDVSTEIREARVLDYQNKFIKQITE